MSTGRAENGKIRPTRQVNVIQRVPFAQQRMLHQPARHGLESDCTHELARRTSEHHVNSGAGLREAARKCYRLVAGYPARDAEQDVSRGKRTHRGGIGV